MVLALKHGDRLDLARPAGRWMAAAARPLLKDHMVAVPVPAHWVRLFRRRYNQAAVLAQRVARETGIEVAVDALVRVRRTRVQEGMDREERYANLEAAIAPHPRRSTTMAGRHVLLVDDVLTSGATLSAATAAAQQAGAASVSVLALARVAREA
jgi:ComF family protein